MVEEKPEELESAGTVQWRYWDDVGRLWRNGSWRVAAREVVSAIHCSCTWSWRQA